MHSTRALYQSGSQGSFGINVSKLYDSLTFSQEGYESKTQPVKTDQWQSVVLKTVNDQATRNRQKLISVTKDLAQTGKHHLTISDESYFQLMENDFVHADNFPNTGFSLDVDKASYSNVRRFITTNSEVPPDAVRIEELINYFNLYYHEPLPGQLFNISTQLTSCPWNERNQLLYLNISAKKLDLDKVPPGNFVFLIDISGSMDMPNRLPLLKAAFQSFVKNLRPVDKISIVVYGGTVGVWMQPTSGSEKDKIIESIEE